MLLLTQKNREVCLILLPKHFKNSPSDNQTRRSSTLRHPSPPPWLFCRYLEPSLLELSLPFELERAIQSYTVHNTLPHIDPVSPTIDAPRMNDPRRQLLRDGKATDSQLESQERSGYGTVDAPSQEENGPPFDKPQIPPGQPQTSEDPAIAEARRSVKRALPILAIGVCFTSLYNFLRSHQLMSISRSY